MQAGLGYTNKMKYEGTYSANSCASNTELWVLETLIKSKTNKSPTYGQFSKSAPS